MELRPGGLISLGPEPGGRLAASLARLLLLVRDAQQNGTWARLKACRNPSSESGLGHH
jgi:hypothetical protein